MVPRTGSYLPERRGAGDEGAGAGAGSSSYEYLRACTGDNTVPLPELGLAHVPPNLGGAAPPSHCTGGGRIRSGEGLR